MIGNPLLLGGGDYEISRSVRLRSSASAYFNRTPSSASNRRTWTWSGWVKRGSLGTQQYIFFAGSGSNDRTGIRWNNDNLEFESQAGGVTQIQLTTSAVYRDASAWYHIVYLLDTTQATAANRAKIYVNGAEVTAFSTATYPSLNADLYPNSTNAHVLGRYNPGPSNYFDGYLTEINFIDGQALTPSSFGETDAVTGVWKPKKYTGTYGTNGFYLNFSDNSNNTATTIGKDYSGNGNNWTPNNISVTSGATYDSMLDVPTLWADGGNGRGNYCTLNPVGSSVSGLTFSAANLDVGYSSTSINQYVRATFGVASGKWYWEVLAGGMLTIGVGGDSINYAAAVNGVSISDSANGWAYLGDTGNKRNNGSGASYGNSYTATDIVGVAVDMDSGKIWFSKNGTWQASGDPAAGTNAAYTNLSGTVYPAGNRSSGSTTTTFNFGQRPFAYTPPSGFKALNTQNLPEPTIKKGNAYFNAITYTGNGSTLSVTGVGFQPDFVWLKSRGAARSHRLWDAVRGATNGLSSDLTNAEYTESGLTAFNSDGFTLGSQSGSNTNAESYVAWNWKEGATQGFDIVTYTGTGVARTIAHSLGVAPAMMLVKSRSNNTGDGFTVYHKSLPSASYWLDLSQTAAQYGPNSAVWNGTAPTSSVFSVGTSSGTNTNNYTYVAYLFAEVAGFSKFGSYTGNGSADGPFVFCGFRPRWVMIKVTSTTNVWLMIDAVRNSYNVANLNLNANTSNAENTSATGAWLDFTSNGFKIRNDSDSAINSSGATYIFAAFAENPFKYSLAR